MGGLVHPLPASLSPSVVGVFGWRRRAGTAVKHCGVSSVARPPLLLPRPLRPSGFGAGFRSPLSFRRALCRRARSTLAVQSPQSANAAKILCAFSRAVCGLLLSIIAGDHLAMRSPLGVCVGWVLLSLDFPPRRSRLGWMPYPADPISDSFRVDLVPSPTHDFTKSALRAPRGWAGSLWHALVPPPAPHGLTWCHHRPTIHWISSVSSSWWGQVPCGLLACCVCARLPCSPLPTVAISGTMPQAHAPHMCICYVYKQAHAPYTYLCIGRPMPPIRIYV